MRETGASNHRKNLHELAGNHADSLILLFMSTIRQLYGKHSIAIATLRLSIGGQMLAFTNKRSHLSWPFLLFPFLTQFCHRHLLLSAKLFARLMFCLHGSLRDTFASAFGCVTAAFNFLERTNHFMQMLLNMPRRGSRSAAFSGNSMRGALAVEYAFCMLIIAVMMSGVQELFWEMAQGIVDNFNDWVSKPYP